MDHEIMLNYLGRSYFHQDYEDFGESPAAIVRTFAEENGIQTVQVFYAELAELLVCGLTEEQARQAWMLDAHSMYDPAKDDRTYLEWLREVLLIVGDVLRGRWLTKRESIGH